MQRFSFLFSTKIHFAAPVSNHSFLLRCLPGHLSCQRVVEAELSVDGAVLRHGLDGLGNRVSWGLIEAEHDTFSFTARGLVESRPYRVCAPLHPMYCSCTELTVCTKDMLAFARDRAGQGTDCTRAERLSQALHEHMYYQSGVTGVHTTAAEAFASRAGVCQDYAHIFIAMCRGLGIASRYVNGYMIGEGETHAWVEVFSCEDGLWLGLDPTNGCSPALGYIKVAHGRDAGDCPVSRGVMTGVTQQTAEISVKVRPVYD